MKRVIWRDGTKEEIAWVAIRHRLNLRTAMKLYYTLRTNVFSGELQLSMSNTKVKGCNPKPLHWAVGRVK